MTVTATSRRVAGGILDVAAVLAIASLVYVPVVSHLAGAIFASDFFFHWDHFALAPALAWRNGMALGTDVYSQYGSGWPVLLVAVSRWIPLSHQNAIGLGVLYGCAVYALLYGLLRYAVGSRALALAGVLLALTLSLYSPVVAAQERLATLWMWPSLGVLRAPLDVPFFFLLLAHARTRRPTFAVALGALTGLALFLETDTGVFLLGTLAVYGVALVVGDRLAAPANPTRPGPRAALVAAACAGALLAVLVAGLSVSSQGTLWTRPGAFLSGWIGGVTNSSELGVGARLFSLFVRDRDGYLLPSLLLLGAGIFAVGDTAVRLLHGRMSARSLLAGSVGLYAVGRLTLFVWRTVPIRLTLAAIPISILVALAVDSALRRRRDATRERPARSSSSSSIGEWIAGTWPAGLALLASAVLLVASPGFGRYPGLWQTVAHGLPEPGLYLFPEKGEVGGLPAEMRPLVINLREMVAAVQRLGAAGESVAVLDPHKTLIDLAAGVRPWRGDASTFINTWTQSELSGLVGDLEEHGPTHAFIRATPPAPPVADTWRALRGVLDRRYEKVGDVGHFEHWRRIDR